MTIMTFFKEMYDFSTKSNNVLDPSTFQGFSIFNRIFGGVKINAESALAHDTVFACVRDKSESIGQLPVRLKRLKNSKWESVETGREHRILTQKPNDYMTMQTFIEMIIATLELRGNFYAYINRNKYDNITEIIPFRFQTSINPQYDTYGRVYYVYTTNDGKPHMEFANKDILHIKNFTLDGLIGASAIYYGARSLGIAISQEDYLANLMENGAMPNGILSTKEVFKDDNAINRIKKQWAEYSGAKGAGKTPILENDLKYQAMSISPADSELILQRGFSREQICGMLRVPPRRIGAIVQTGSKRDVEQENKDYYQNSLMPIVRKIENALNLILPDTLKLKLDEREFLRGDFKSAAEAAHELVKSGLGSLNEGREFLGLEDKDGGDVHAIDTNNLTFGRLEDISRLQEEQRALMMNSNKPKEGSEEDDNEA